MNNQKYDIIIVGGGHAGIEASLVSARFGYKTLLLTINIDNIGKMSCNPAIGGIAKGHMVRELDALGGAMGIITDITGIQYRMLNRSKGPAVHAPRAQIDKKEYQNEMQYLLEQQDNLYLIQDNVSKIICEDNNTKAIGIKTYRGFEYYGDRIILTTGTFLEGLIHIGSYKEKAGRMGDCASDLSKSLEEIGLTVKTMKTGTPARIDGNTIDFSKTEEQSGDEELFSFSHFTKNKPTSKVSCYITYTNKKTHEIIEKYKHLSPMFSGTIKSIGPRYCPSIEDKVHRFADKERHQLFLEPEGLKTNEYYVNGLSTSLPEEIQWEIVHSIPGLEEAHLNRIAYAIEYDYCPPIQLKATLETKKIKNLYLAGQINGTSGYEEAAVQGWWAAVNSILDIRNEKPLILTRTESYIGVLIDDLITKGVEEPYRMFTSRAEYRLNLRYDNADERLMHIGNDLGLIDKQNYDKIKEDLKKRDEIINFCECKHISQKYLKSFDDEYKDKVKAGEKIATLIKRKVLPINQLKKINEEFINISEDIWNKASIYLVYEGYLKRQREEINRFQKYEKVIIPDDFNYDEVKGLLTEARQKLKEIKPISIGQAARISGVNPSDISVLMLYLRKKK